MNCFVWTFREELKLQLRNSHGVLQPLFFFILIVAVFPLAMPAAQTSLIQSMAPGVIWVAAILAILLSLGGLFGSDHRDGTLEQWILSGHPLVAIILAKVLARWSASGLLMSLLSPMVAWGLGLSGDQILALLLALLPGTLIICLIGAAGAALTLNARQGGLLLSVLVLPLYVPVLIFGAGLVPDAAAGTTLNGPFYFLVSMMFLAMTLVPLAIGLAFKHTLD